ncbi:MAG: hypothetical protein HQ477_09410 [Chloroflexi bacterium]|nr:hypothetical protein [Chloroflexota bacterium]
MLQAVATLLTVELIGIATLAVVARSFPVLADRGWAISKPVGLLLISTTVWLLSYAQLLPNSPAVWWSVLIVLSLVSSWILKSDFVKLRRSMVRRWQIVLTVELIFIVFFVMFLSMRAFDPAASGTEKPMDLMMLTAVTSSEYAPPQDLWLAGEPIAYYYFGYWIYGGVSTMAGVTPSVAFNVGIALVAGMAASVATSLVITLIRRDGAHTKISLISGGVTATLLLLVSNLSGLWTILDITKIAPNSLLNWYQGDQYDRIDRIVTWRPDDFWWWWNSSRITNTFSETGEQLDFTIQEYPFFSFLLGDFHPHLMSIPFVLTGVTVLIAFFIAHRTISFGVLRKNIPAAGIIAIVIGASGFINFWDVGLLLFLTTGLVVTGWIGSRSLSTRSFFQNVLPMVSLWVIGIFVFAPFYFGTAASQVQWPPLAPVKYGTRPIHFLSIWLLLITVGAPTVILLANRYTRLLVKKLRGNVLSGQYDQHLFWRPAWIVGVVLTGGPWLIWAITHLSFNEPAQATDVISRLPVSAFLGGLATILIAVVLTRARRGADGGSHFVLLLSALAVYLLFAAELFFVHDLFGNRMNTVFKFYYQAWILLSVVGGYGVYIWWKYHSSFNGKMKLFSRTALAVLTVLVITSVYFPIAAAVSKTVSSGIGPNLDSLSFMDSSNSDELDVISEISEIATSDDVLVEAVGGSYTEFGRISGSSGVPAILGWTFHETQWHGTDALFSDREADVRTIYTSRDPEELIMLVNKYVLTMIVVGPRERSTYGNIDMAMFDRLGDRIIEHGSYTVFGIN